MTKNSIHLAGVSAAIVLFLLALNGGRADPAADEAAAIEEAQIEIAKLGGRFDPKSKDEDTGDPVSAVAFANSNLSDGDLLSVSRALKTLNPKKLNLGFTKVNGDGVWEHLCLPDLIDLDLSSTLVDGKGLRGLKQFRKLQSLRLNSDRLDTDALADLLAHWSADHDKNLNLYLSRATVTQPYPAGKTDEWLIEVFKEFSKSKQAPVEGLDISYTGVTDKGLQDLKGKFASLTRLNLSGNEKATDDGLTTLTDAGLAFLEDTKIEGLTFLDLSRTGIELGDLGASEGKNKGVLNLLNCQRLKILCLSSTGVTDPCLKKLLVNNAGLDKLDLSDTRTLSDSTSADTKEVQVAIGKLKLLTDLNLSATGVDDVGMKNIWRQLATPEFNYNGNLKTLNVSKTNLTDGWLIGDLLDTRLGHEGQITAKNAVAFPKLETISITEAATTLGGMTTGGINRRMAFLRTSSWGKLAARVILVR